MKFTFDFSIDDWMAFQKHYFSTSKQIKKIKFFAIIIIPVLFGLIPFFDLIFGNGLKNPAKYFVLASISLIWIFWYPKYFQSSILKKTKKMLEDGNNTSIIGQHEIEFSEEYLTVKEPGNEYKTFWKKINKIEENEQYIFIFITSVSACVIPKFKIKKEDLEKIKNFLKNK